MNPEAIAELAKTFGLPAAILLFMWINRNPLAKTDKPDPAKQIADDLHDIKASVGRIEADIKASVGKIEADMKVLLDRKSR